MIHKNSCISMLFHLYRHSCFISYCLLGPCPVTRPYPEFGAAPEARHPRPSDRACFAQCCPGAPLLGLWLKLSRRGHVLHCWYWQAWLVCVHSSMLTRRRIDFDISKNTCDDGPRDVVLPSGDSSECPMQQCTTVLPAPMTAKADCNREYQRDGAVLWRAATPAKLQVQLFHWSSTFG
jgi:hypothetical protein